MSLSRRQVFASATALAFAGLAARAHAAQSGFIDGPSRNEVYGYGPLKPDPYGLLDLPEGFSYRVVSQVGQTMSDGLLTPDRFDGMGCFPLDDDRVILVRNHEVNPDEFNGSAWGAAHRLAQNIERSSVYGVYPDPEGGVYPVGGGTVTLVYNLKTGELERHHLSLGGTVRNCSGGLTPWGSWLTCEETLVDQKEGLPQAHGWVFEVPARATGLVEPRPIRDMGRFRREAACVDPRTGVVYLTEDVDASLFYRFLPNQPGNLHAGGRLQALAVKGQASADTRNWQNRLWQGGDRFDVEWIDLTDTHNPERDLHLRGHAAGAAIFARGEGIHWAGDHLYFACTSGGPGQHGQLIRYIPSPHEGRPEEASTPASMDLFVESADAAVMDRIDNITIAPNGHIIACEDRKTGHNHIRAVTPSGQTYSLARNPQPHDADEANNEIAGACFSPDGQTLFFNLFKPGATLAVTGPWSQFRA